MSATDTRTPFVSKVQIEDANGDVLGVNADGTLPVSSGTGTSATEVQGTAADGAAAVGNPVQIGGKDPSGNIQSVSVNSSGAISTVVGSTGGDSSTNSLGSITDGPTAYKLWVAPSLFNDTNWDRHRNNTEVTALASAARTASVDSADLTNHNAKGLHVIVDVTAIVTAPSITVTIQGKGALSGKYYTLLTSAAITATGTTVLKVYPGITAAANASASDLLPRTYRVSVTHANADSITYSIGANLVL